MENDIQRGTVANVLALHYIDPENLDGEKWFKFVEKWILNHGLTPTKMSGKGSKSIAYSRGKKALEKDDFLWFKDRSISILALPSDERVSTEIFDFIMSSDISVENGFKRSECLFCWDDQIVPWDDSYIKKILKDVLHFFKAKYGYAFQRKFDLGPSLYPAGVISGLDYGRKERKEITNWDNLGLLEHSLYQPHMIRDVYPLNFLSPQHLKAPIGDQTLEQWIQEDPSRGTLEELLPNFWCWSVDKQNINSVKVALKPHNLLIAHMDF
ncbi:MAG: hypothetical protein NWR43_01930 [Alphaproteobacteria bacterium]|nr:hypothetical protein [Alphaproteobacteria bacterium]